MKELDIVLLHHLEKHYPNAEERGKLAFEKILDMQDPELYSLILGNVPSDDKDISDVVEILRNTPRY